MNSLIKVSVGIKAIWSADSRRYVLVEDMSKVIRKEGEIYLTIKELMREIAEMNSKLLEDISKAKIIYDPYKIISSIREGIKRGFFPGSKEVVIRKITGILLRLKDTERRKEEILFNAYMAATDSLQAIILKKTGKIVVPKKIAQFVKENFPELSQIAKEYEVILKAIKDLEHKRKLPSGKELDKIIRYAEKIFEVAEVI